MNDDNNYQPDPDFVAKTMERIYAYETSKKTFSVRAAIYNVLQRYILAFGGALFGILHATRVF